MANWNQALEWMKEGKKVTTDGSYYYVLLGPLFKFYHKDGSAEDFPIDTDDFVQTDWKLFEEEKWTFDKAYDKFISENRTSHKWLSRKGMEDAEHFGDCIFIDYQGVEERKDRLKEFIEESIKKCVEQKGDEQ